MDRRSLFKAAGSSLALGAVSCTAVGASSSTKKFPFKKSFTSWCYNGHWTIDEQIAAAKKLGCDGLELVDNKHWDKLKAAGLECSLTRSHGFVKGMNNPVFHAENIQKMKEQIDQSKKYNFPSVITFVGFADTTSVGGSKIDPEEGIKNCIEGYKKIIGYAEKQGVTLQMEVLNSRVSTKMKGHPGFAGDKVEYCGEIIRAIGSERLKILFDVYHVQVMQGDLITRIEQNMDIIGHVHTAGCPGRNELDNTQEINYPAVMKKLHDLGFDKYVTHEFIPTRDPFAGLVEAFDVCSI
ncbi:MAG: TIM barrel protein [Lentisphaeraceae bacterium]|nr:TIM barrel protein [Lentisphaeraceae bacterium]